MKLWLIPIGIVFLKALLNLVNAAYLRARYKLFLDWMGDNSVEKLKQLRESKTRTIALMKQAGISDKGLPITQPMGYGQIANMTISMFEQYPSRIQVIAAVTVETFEHAIGTYKGRAIDAINPLYWISLVVYLPTRVCSSLGAKVDSIPVKILQGLYWLAAAIIGSLLVFAKPAVVAFLRKWLDKIS